ncbi:MAG: hypothetical protein HXY40_05790 [Chloroflexi bacterium]|nr:hypothetical protein [Chloroflexota bacterium]
MADQTQSKTTRGLSATQQIERLVLTIALLGLALSGLPQRFADQPLWAHTLIALLGGVESARILHRFFAVLLMTAIIYHLLAVGYGWFVLGKRPLRWPDAADYTFVLKLEYLFLALACLILLITGLMLWNPIAVLSVLPGETIPTARSIHAAQVLLLVLVLILGIGGINGEPSLRSSTLTFETFCGRVRLGENDMPAFSAEELPDGYVLHLWTWLRQPAPTPTP